MSKLQTNYPLQLVIFRSRFSAPELVWSELQYTVTESSGSSEICAQIIGTLNEVVEIPLSTADITAVGM